MILHEYNSIWCSLVKFRLQKITRTMASWHVSCHYRRGHHSDLTKNFEWRCQFIQCLLLLWHFLLGEKDRANCTWYSQLLPQYRYYPLGKKIRYDWEQLNNVANNVTLLHYTGDWYRFILESKLILNSENIYITSE